MRSPLIEVLQDLEAQGIVLSLDESSKLRLRGPKGSLSPELLERVKPHKEALRLILEKGTKVFFCYGCGKQTEFYPTPKIMDVFRRWACSECGWEFWSRDFNTPPDNTLLTIMRAFRNSAVVRYAPRETGHGPQHDRTVPFCGPDHP